jgi:hypothetical protein
MIFVLAFNPNSYMIIQKSIQLPWKISLLKQFQKSKACSSSLRFKTKSSIVSFENKQEEIFNFKIKSRNHAFNELR